MKRASNTAELFLDLETSRFDQRMAGAKKSVVGLGGQFKSMATVAKTALAGIAIGALVKGLNDAVRSAADFASVRDAFLTTGGSIDELRRDVGGLQTDLEIMASRNRAHLLGLSDETFVAISRAARAMSASTGKDMGALIESAISAVAKGSKNRLAELGVNIDKLGARADWSRTLIVELNAAVERAGGISDSTADRIARMDAQWKNLRTTMTLQLLPAFERLLPWIEKVSSGIHELFTGERFGRLHDEGNRIGEQLAAGNRYLAAVHGLQDRQAKLADEIRLVQSGELAAYELGFDNLDTMQAAYVELGSVIATLSENADAAANAISKLNTTSKDAPSPAASAGKKGSPRRRRRKASTDMGGPGDPTFGARDTGMTPEERVGWLLYGVAMPLDEVHALQAEEAQKQSEAESSREAMRARLRQQHTDAERRKEEAITQMQEEHAQRRMEIYSMVTSFVGGKLNQMAAISLDALERLVAGEKVELAKLAANFIKATGLQIMGIGTRAGAEGVAQLASTQGTVGHAGVIVGSTLIGSGASMAATGAIGGGLASRTGFGTIGGSASPSASIHASGGGFGRRSQGGVREDVARGRSENITIVFQGGTVIGDPTTSVATLAKLRRRAMQAAYQPGG